MNSERFTQQLDATLERANRALALAGEIRRDLAQHAATACLWRPFEF